MLGIVHLGFIVAMWRDGLHVLIDTWKGGLEGGMMRGMKWTAGTWFNFEAPAMRAEVIEVRVGRAGALAGLDVSGAAFEFRYRSSDGVVRTAGVEHGEVPGKVFLHLPQMEAGEYAYELGFTDALGEAGVLLCGRLSVFSRREFEERLEAADKAAVRVLEVQASSLHDGPLELRWCASSAAAQFAEDAKEAAKDAEAAAGVVDGLKGDVLEMLQIAQTFIANFNKALLESIKVVDNYLWIGGVNTGHYLKGDDAPVPEYREDGYLYIGGERVAKIKGEDGITPHITSDGYWAIGSVKTSVRAAGRDGLNGTSVRRILIESEAELPKEEVRGVYYYIRREGHYDVFVWLEPDGWVCVGEANDIATAELYGLVKLGTDSVVADGAPVGKDSDGQMAVPLAGTAVAGTGKLGTGTVLTEGGPVGLTASGAMGVGRATLDGFGVVKLGTSTVLTEGGVLGMNAAGNAMVPWATLHSAGVVRLGSQYGQSNPIPYIVGIGATQTHELANNYAFGGALQHRKPDGWRGTMAWLDASIEANAGYFNDMFYSGLLTSGQFTQGQNTGLELLAADEGLLAGVYLAVDMYDTRPAAVPNAAMLADVDEKVRKWVDVNFAKLDEVVTQEELTLRLQDYLLKVDAKKLYATKVELADLSADVVHKSDPYLKGMVLTEAEYNALGERVEDDCVYIIV